MNVVFYNNSSDNNVVHKNITQIKSYECELHRECMVQNPTLLVPMEDALLSANYCYIAKFNRYYYISGISIYSGNLTAISLKVDVLMSFWDNFKDSPCQAKRSYSHFNKNMEDETRTYNPQPDYEFRRISNMEFRPNREGTYVLTTSIL